MKKSSCKSRITDSNCQLNFGRVTCYHYTNSAKILDRYKLSSINLNYNSYITMKNMFSMKIYPITIIELLIGIEPI